MRTAIGLAVIAAGAILTFAVSAHTPGINLHVAGVIIMLAGLAGLITPARAAHWLRHRGQAGEADPGPIALTEPAVLTPEEAYPAYLLQDPAVLAAEVLNGARAGAYGNGGRPGPQRNLRVAGQRPVDEDWES